MFKYPTESQKENREMKNRTREIKKQMADLSPDMVNSDIEYKWSKYTF